MIAFPIMLEPSVISIKNFSKSFGGKQVVSDLSFDVYKKEIFAFIGANGSGKTTTIRALLGIYEADNGQLLVNGKKYTTEQAELVGYLPEERGLYTSAKVLDTLIFFGQIKGLSRADAYQKSTKYLERVGLADTAAREIKTLSSGQQQKIQLGITIINEPQILILDEPTKGLDPVNRQLLFDILMELKAKGSTIIFSTHHMEEAEEIADRVFMIKDGHQALYGEINQIKENFSENQVAVKFKGEKFPSNNSMYTVEVVKDCAVLNLKKSASTNEILKYLLSKNIEILGFEKVTPSLNDIFVKVSNETNY